MSIVGFLQEHMGVVSVYAGTDGCGQLFYRSVREQSGTFWKQPGFLKVYENMWA